MTVFFVSLIAQLLIRRRNGSLFASALSLRRLESVWMCSDAVFVESRVEALHVIVRSR